MKHITSVTVAKAQEEDFFTTIFNKFDGSIACVTDAIAVITEAVSNLPGCILAILFPDDTDAAA